MTIVLSNVEVNRPWSQLVRHFFIRRPELGIGVTFLDQCTFGCVVAKKIQIGVSQVALESKRTGHVGGFEKVQHVLPAVHAGPADFAFGRQTLTVSRSDNGGFSERCSDRLCVGCRILTPLVDAEFGRVDTNHAVLTHTVLVEDLRDAAGLLHRQDELGSLHRSPHGRIAHGARPDWSDQ